MEFSEPADISVFDDFGESDIDLVERRLEAFDDFPPWITEVFVFGYGKKKVDDVFRVLARVFDFEHTKQCPEHGTRDIVAFVTKNLYEMLGIASARRLNLGYDADILPKIVGFLSFSLFHSSIRSV